MQFKVGDKVSLLDENFYAFVIKVLENNILLLEDQDGFERKCSTNEVVKIEAERYQHIPIQVKKLDKEESKRVVKRKKHIPVVDLHMENLVDSHSGMTNHEIVLFQLKYFKNKLETYKRRGIKEFIVVHGIGSGKLKAEVRYILDGYLNIEYMDDHISGYGVGATRVYLV